ncbi:hypothetical protein E4T56_gene11802 [Termitomyces sp. T112]|nr:hypothetical protein E4T56_gene11802 [Termitomyces sp. T112]
MEGESRLSVLTENRASKGFCDGSFDWVPPVLAKKLSSVIVEIPPASRTISKASFAQFDAEDSELRKDRDTPLG